MLTHDHGDHGDEAAPDAPPRARVPASHRLRTGVKHVLARASASRRPASGASLLIHHRVGGGTLDELDLPVAAFRAQVAALAALPAGTVVPIDTALDRLRDGDPAPSVVLTFDDGFADVHTHAWPLLRDHGLPFTLYLASGCIGGEMRWEGSTGTSAGAPALTWEHLREMHASGLLTVGNHTRSHARPDDLSEAELDDATRDIEANLGVSPDHFAYPWGVRVPAMEDALRRRFRSAATGALGRNLPGCDPVRLERIPVRRTDPLPFYRAKLNGGLAPERAYARIVAAGKKAGARA